MISVILIWCVIALSTYITGFAVRRLFAFITKENVKGYPGGTDSVSDPARAHNTRMYTSLAGLIAAGVYAEFFSLFHRVYLGALSGWIAIALISAFICARPLLDDLGDLAAGVLAHKVFAGISVCALLVCALFTSQGTWHIDTPLYHAMSIHWIEDYGTVKGLGNLQTHFAYNNACFPLYALFGMRFVTGQSFHVVQGYLAMLLLEVGIFFPEKKPCLSAFARVAALGYLATILDEIVSPASDYCFTLLVFLIAIAWLDREEEGEECFLPYALLVMAAVYCVTVKLAAAPLLLLTVRPVRLILKEKAKSAMRTGIFVMTGVLIALPFFIRDYYLSGWLLFPVPWIDLFDPVWKVPEGVTAFEAYDISMTGRAIFTFSGEPVPPVSEWFPAWFARQAVLSRAMFLASVLAIPLLPFAIKPYPEKKAGPALPLTILVCTLFWFFTSPQIRFGQAYLWLMTAIAYGGLLLRFALKASGMILRAGKTLAAAFAVLMIIRAAPYDTAYLLTQQDYDRYACGTYEIDGIRFYYPEVSTVAGYHDFPSTRWKVENVRALGMTAGEGFCVIGDGSR